MEVRFFAPGDAYRRIKPEIDATIHDVLGRGDLILRKDVEQFESNFAEYVGTKYAVGVASGTDALFLSLKYAEVGEDDEVLAPSYTFRATIEAICNVGAEPVLYDLDEPPVFSRHTVAWIPAYIAGEYPEWVPAKIEEAEQKGIIVIEDACQAIGAAPIGGLSACYSFYPAKILGCYGDGGAIATDSKEMYEWLKIARNHFKGDWKDIGWNSRLDNLQAAVLNVKLKHLPKDLMRRKQIAMMYDKGLIGVRIPKPRMVYQDYIIECEDAESLKNHLASQGIETMSNGYPFPYGIDKGPRCLMYEENSLRLPCHPDLTDDQVGHVISAINLYAAMH